MLHKNGKGTREFLGHFYLYFILIFLYFLGRFFNFLKNKQTNKLNKLIFSRVLDWYEIIIVNCPGATRLVGCLPPNIQRAHVGVNYQPSSWCVAIQFSLYLVHNSWLLQEILLDSGSFNNRMSVKVDVDVFPKSTGVVISHGLCIAKGWKATKINHGADVRNTALRHLTKPNVITDVPKS